MPNWQAFVRRVTTSRYARELEAELALLHADNDRQREENSRLRAENRALINSILGIAGIPPVIVEEMPATPEIQNPASTPAQPPTSRKGKGIAAAPTRRRSWHQAMRARELASARKDQIEP